METCSYGQVELSYFDTFCSIPTHSKRVSHIGGSDDFNVVFVGAGNIMFGVSTIYHYYTD
jgi:hypothetical protein